MTRILIAGAVVWATASLGQIAGAQQRPAAPASETGGVIHPQTAFATSHECIACHNGLTTPAGEDVSIGASWRGSMMANSSRDPYWRASVRRETIDHPLAAAEIENECSICHMPLSNAQARASGGRGEVFRVLADPTAPEAALAADGVSCALCHQIGPERLGTRASFNGGFALGREGTPRMAGPFAVDAGRTAIMRSATGATPLEAPHIRESEVCATCHTLFTRALGPQGQVVGELPEQVPYLEWRHSAFPGEQRSCQTCHMPAVDVPTPISSVLGEPRPGLARHTFLGGNFFMLRMLNRYRVALGVEATPGELEAGAAATLRQLDTNTATVAIQDAAVAGGELVLAVQVANLTGHKLPTGYPSRRAWLHVTVRDGQGRAVFESGAVSATGAIAGNDNDADATRFEPHHTEIREADAVQIYESVMGDVGGRVTTGLLQATQFVKDNRLLPRGFDPRTAGPEIAVRGGAATDPDFAASGDRIRYVIDLRGAPGPFAIEVVLRYQPIAFRWARNLSGYDAPEPRRFVSYFDSMAASSSAVLARAAARVN